MVKQTVLIALTSAVAIEGTVYRAGEQVEVKLDLAENLLHRGRGTLVEVDDEATDADSDEGEIDLNKLSKAQLLEQAKAWEVEYNDSMTKAQLIELITAKAAEAE